jgi:hypothetical protein
MGIRGNISRSTLADANESRDWRIYADFAQVSSGRLKHASDGRVKTSQFQDENNDCLSFVNLVCQGSF